MAKKQSADVTFKYGECKTDHKPGDEIRHRQTDYMNDEPYASRVKDMLEQMGLPQPKKNEVFRGTYHDLLFLDSHGVVLRIGPTDVEDLMNPAVIQPLGWMEDKGKIINHNSKQLPFTVAIYPGIELLRDFLADKNAPKETTNLQEFLKNTGQDTMDLHMENIGIIRVKDDTGKETAVEVLLDPDNSFNSSTDTDAVQTRTSRFALAQKESGNNADALEATIGSMFGNVENAKLYERAFAVHQPLRRMFWEKINTAAPDGKPASNSMRSFWNACAETVNNPKTHFHNTATYQITGSHCFQRSKQTTSLETVLYRPWTGNSRDSVAAVKRALANAKKPPIQRAISGFIEALREHESSAARSHRHLPKPLRNIMRKPLVQAMMHNPLTDLVVKIDQQVNFLLVGLPREAEKKLVKAWKNLKEQKKQSGTKPESQQPSQQEGGKKLSSPGMFAHHLDKRKSGEPKKVEDGFNIKPKSFSGVHGKKDGIFKLLRNAKKFALKIHPDRKREKKQQAIMAASGPKAAIGKAARISAPSPGGMKK